MLKNILKFFIFCFNFFVGILSTFAFFGFERVNDNLKGNGNNIEVGINNTIGYLLNYLYIIAFIWILWSGFQIMTAAGDDEKIKTGKKRILYTFIGVVIIYFSYIIITSFIFGISNK